MYTPLGKIPGKKTDVRNQSQFIQGVLRRSIAFAILDSEFSILRLWWLPVRSLAIFLFFAEKAILPVSKWAKSEKLPPLQCVRSIFSKNNLPAQSLVGKLGIGRFCPLLPKTGFEADIQKARNAITPDPPNKGTYPRKVLGIRMEKGSGGFG